MNGPGEEGYGAPGADPSRALRQQESLREVIEAISSELELQPLLMSIVRHACALLQAENGTIGLVDEDRQLVRTAAAYRMPAPEIGAEIPRGEGLFGRVYESGGPVVLERYGDVARPTRAELLEYAVIGVPIFWAGRMLGVFGLGSPAPRRFGPDDVETLSLYAKHAAIAIENARRYELERRRRERLATIARIGRIVAGSPRLEELLERAVEAVHAHLGYAHVAVGLPDPDDPANLLVRHTVGGLPPPGGWRLPADRGILGAAARERRIQLVRDVRTDPRYLPTPGAEGVVSEIAAPLLLGDRLLGVLNVESAERLGEEDAHSLEIIADQLAVAVANARLLEQMEQALEETRLLYRTGERIGQALDVEGVVRAYLEQVGARGLFACTVALYGWDAAGRRSTVRVLGTWTPDGGIRLEPEEHPYTRDALDPLLDRGETVTIADVETDPRATPELRSIQRRSGRPALALIPLMAGEGKRIGLVVLSSPERREWREEELRPFQATGAQLAATLALRLQQQLLLERGQQVAVLEERQRLARELHDSVTQTLFSLTLIAQAVGPAWRREPAEGERRVGRILELSQSALAEMRALLAELGPAPVAAGDTPEETEPLPPAPPSLARLQEVGLATALRRHVEEAARDGGLEARFAVRGYRPLPPAVEEALFRIAQEAVANVVKHAEAREVSVALACRAAAAVLTVADDGVGIPPRPGRDRTRGGLGLANMRRRAEEVGGALRVARRRTGGTRVRAVLPLPVKQEPDPSPKKQGEV